MKPDGQQPDDEKPSWRRKLDADLTRRQFLTYALGGTGAFMGTLIGAPLVVSAFDPIHRSGGSSFSKTNWTVKDFNEQYPTRVSFNQQIEDGWNTHAEANDVYVIIKDNKLMIMSHVCTHLGCHVDGSIENGKSVAPKYGNGQWFQCPCHGSQYNIYGVPTPSSPAPKPLPLYTYRVESNGTISVGSELIDRTNETWDQNPNPSIS